MIISGASHGSTTAARLQPTTRVDSDVKNDAKGAHSSVTPGGAAPKNASGQFIHEDVCRYLFTHPVVEVGTAVLLDPNCRMDLRKPAAGPADLSESSNFIPPIHPLPAGTSAHGRSPPAGDPRRFRITQCHGVNALVHLGYKFLIRPPKDNDSGLDCSTST